MGRIDLRDRVSELVRGRDWFGLRSELEGYDLPELAALLRDLEPNERSVVFRLLPRDRAAEVFAELEKGDAQELLKALTERKVRRLLTEMAPDDRTALLEELPGQVTQRLLNLLPPEELREARALLGYPDESVGRLMTTDYVAVRPWWTIGEALDHIRRRARDSETVDVVYVVDDDWRLIDAVELRKFILADPDARVESVMDRRFAALPATADREEAVRLMRAHDVPALPVTDSQGVLVGIVTVDDVLDVAEEETTEDFHKGAAMLPLPTGYSGARVVELYRRRLPWLVALVFVNIASSGVIAAFEDVLASTIALAFFIPLLIDSGGNTGAQSATLVTRALATGDVRMGEWLRTLGKELAVGLTLGLSMGLAAMGLGFIRGGWDVAMVVGLSMLAIVLASNLLGALLPMALARFRLDPAVASSPLITSVADVTGLLIYFAIATAVLGGAAGA